MADQWVERWKVTGTSGKDYTVALKKDRTWGCSCPAWTMQKQSPRKDCQHILQKQMELLRIDGTPLCPLTGTPTIRVGTKVRFDWDGSYAYGRVNAINGRFADVMTTRYGQSLACNVPIADLELTNAEIVEREEKKKEKPKEKPFRSIRLED